MDQKHNIEHEEIVDGLVYKIVKTEKDAQRVLDFYFDHMMEDESACKSKGGFKGKRQKGMSDEITGYIKDGVSVICVDPAKDVSVGIMTAWTSTRSVGTKLDPKIIELPELRKSFHEIYAVLCYFLAPLTWAPMVYEKNPDVDKILHLNSLGTLREYRRKGIGNELAKQVLKVGVKANCDASVVIASHVASNRIFQKNGMEKMTNFKWKDSVIDGKVYFDSVDNEEANGYILKFKKT